MRFCFPCPSGGYNRQRCKPKYVHVHTILKYMYVLYLLANYYGKQSSIVIDCVRLTVSMYSPLAALGGMATEGPAGLLLGGYLLESRS